jgi:hypothetical protein
MFSIIPSTTELIQYFYHRQSMMLHGLVLQSINYGCSRFYKQDENSKSEMDIRLQKDGSEIVQLP